MKPTITAIVGLCIAGVLSIAASRVAPAQDRSLTVDAFLTKAAASDLVCQIPPASSGILEQTTELDLEISKLSEAERKRLHIILDEMKRLQRLDCARLHLCRLYGAYGALRGAQVNRQQEQVWIDLAKKIFQTSPGLEYQPIQTAQLDAELRRAIAEQSKSQLEIMDASLSFDIEREAIEKISDLREESVSRLVGEVGEEIDRIDSQQNDGQEGLAKASRPDLKLKILMSETFSSKTTATIESWAIDSVELEVRSARERFIVARKALDEALDARDRVQRESQRLSISPLSLKFGVPNDLGWLIEGFERGAVPASDLLWGLRNLNEKQVAVAEAQTAVDSTMADLACASGAPVRSHMIPSDKGSK